MKKAFGLAIAMCILSSASAFATVTTIKEASTLSIKITSFTNIDSNSHTAELCGQVTVSSPALPSQGNYIAVTVTSDPGNNSAPYTVMINPAGVFCTLIATYTGTATATAWFATDQVSATTELVKVGSVTRQ